eukprot:2316795-Rhodomonas_salina.2
MGLLRPPVASHGHVCVGQDGEARGANRQMGCAARTAGSRGRSRLGEACGRFRARTLGCCSRPLLPAAASAAAAAHHNHPQSKPSAQIGGCSGSAGLVTSGQ